MGVVLAAALGITALRSGSDAWTGATFLTTCGVLACGVLAALNGRRDQRAWWIGFSLFGWGYLALAFMPTEYYGLPLLPTSRLLGGIIERVGIGVRFQGRGGVSLQNVDRWAIEHCLWGLLFAILGGILASWILAEPVAPPAPVAERPSPPRRAAPWWKRFITLFMLLELVLFVVAGLAWSRSAPGLWAGLTLVMTWALLGLLALGAIFRRGRYRARWLGAVVFGVGFLMLVPDRDRFEPSWPGYATTRLLDWIRPRVPWIASETPTDSETIAEANARIIKVLDRKVPMRFSENTPLERFLAHIKTATRDRDGREITIYVDPVGLQEAEKTMESIITLDMDGVPLKTTLGLGLRQLGMDYMVKGGVLQITAADDAHISFEVNYPEPFLMIGQCVLSWLAAGLGSVLAPRVSGGNPPAED